MRRGTWAWPGKLCMASSSWWAAAASRGGGRAWARSRVLRLKTHADATSCTRREEGWLLMASSTSCRAEVLTAVRR